MGRSSFVELCRTEDDWKLLREVFVRSFLKYPLYEYLVRDEANRAEFLDRYLKAHYEVNVRCGNSPLICIRMLTERTEAGDSKPNHRGNLNEVNENEQNQMSVIVGGVLFVTPSRDGNGWENEIDDVYHKAYKKFKLDEVDRAAFERLLRYEAWETRHVTGQILALKIPLWNGMFCAIDPAYSRNGCGTVNYADCMRLMTQVHEKLQEKGENTPDRTAYKSVKKRTVSNGWGQRPSPEHSEKLPKNGSTSSFNFPFNMFHSLSFLSHHSHGYAVPSSAPRHDTTGAVGHVGKVKRTPARVPMVVALSHSHRAVDFHRRNGFRVVKKIPYNPIDQTNSPFDICILFSDPFKTGQLDAVASKLGENETRHVARW